MPKEVSLFDGNKLPSYLQTREIDDVTKSLMGSGGGGIKRISIKGGVWRLMINGKEVSKNEERSLPIVIVNAAPYNSRTYYEGSYTEGAEPTRPTCWSANGITPDPKVPSAQASRCLDCPQNVKGSGQGDSRACRYSRRLAVVLANDIEGDVYQLTLPAKSIFGEGEHNKWPLEAYGKFIGSKGIPITAVVTEARFDTDQATPTITFKPLRFLEVNEHAAAVAQGESEAAKKAITMTVSEADNVKKAPPSAAPVAAPVEVAAPAEATDEPIKRSSKKNEAPPEKPDLSKLLDSWDD
jgi:hypothetical protein